jgi:hypothetical protein
MDREALMASTADTSHPQPHPESEPYEQPAVRINPPPPSRNDRRPATKRAKAHKARGPAAKKKKKKKDPEIPLGQLSALSIQRFCKLHSISPAYYFLLRKRDEGPVEMRMGGKVLISAEEAAKWRRRHEQPKQNQDKTTDSITQAETEPH